MYGDIGIEVLVDTTTGALIVAALSVIATPLTAWLTFRWTRTTEAERSIREREGEREGYERAEKNRRLLRGEEAANDILAAVDDAQLVLSMADREGNEGMALYDELRPLYHRIKQQSELLTDDESQRRIGQIADNLYYHSQARELNPNLGLGQIAYTCSEAAHMIVRAYLLGRPMPVTQRMDRLQQLHEEGEAFLREMHDDDDDPLDEPTAN
ncbi:MAG: hypothetical protein QOH61_1671 [Chloroflexota bacterium]|jgi:hypothetical protein|nr:hypothetical protein [Chloroflexota bacterium]